MAQSHGPEASDRYGSRATEWGGQPPSVGVTDPEVEMLGRLKVAAGAGALAAALLGGAVLATPAFADSPSADAAAFVANINSLRASLGLGSLSVDPALTTIATGWSTQLAQVGTLSHNPDLTTQAPSDWETLGENVGVGPSEPALQSAFTASPDHYANMVDPHFTQVGVAVVEPSPGILYVTEDYMGVEAATPSVVTAPPPTTTPTTAPKPVSTSSSTTSSSTTSSSTTAPTTAAPAPVVSPVVSASEPVASAHLVSAPVTTTTSPPPTSPTTTSPTTTSPPAPAASTSTSSVPVSVTTTTGTPDAQVADNLRPVVLSTTVSVSPAALQSLPWTIDGPLAGSALVMSAWLIRRRRKG